MLSTDTLLNVGRVSGEALLDRSKRCLGEALGLLDDPEDEDPDEEDRLEGELERRMDFWLISFGGGLSCSNFSVRRFVIASSKVLLSDLRRSVSLRL